jgi:protocatechuate 3,4-dioxygenase beta subunit
MGYLITRREALERCTAIGLLLAGPGLTLSTVGEAWEQAEKAASKPTPRNEVGPFYKKHAPFTTHLRALGDLGMPLSVSGNIFDTRGEPIQDAVVEVWHTDHFGHYDLTGYKFRGQIRPPAGAYNFETVMPGHYPDRVCQHVHYMVSAPGHKTLVTQLYFATDPALEGDPDKNYVKDPVLQSRELIRPVTLQTDGEMAIAKAVFDLCLERS